MDPGSTCGFTWRVYLGLGLMWTALHFKTFILVLCERRRVWKVRQLKRWQQGNGESWRENWKDGC